ncbi:MAG TPA: hypothetical protein VFG95_08665 [Nitrospiria bacterium]|nr:hypothetical protein [Nitrospiria bacterium]
MRTAASIAPEVDLPPFAPSPNWLTTISFIIPAVSLDLTERLEWPLWTSGATSGVLLGGTYYGTYPFFSESTFRFGTSDAMTAIFASFLGGMISAGIVWTGGKRNGKKGIESRRVLQSQASGRRRRTAR